MLVWIAPASSVAGADKLVALYSSHAVPYAMPWVAESLGLFKKYDIDFEFVYIPSSSTATAAILGSNVEIGLLGGVGIVNAYASGANDLVFIGSIKNVMTQSILAKPEITKLEQLRAKRVGVTRIGSNTHFFTVQVFRRAGMNPDKDITFIQTGGDNETLGALVSGRIDAAAMLPPTDGRAIALGFRYVVFGPDLAIPYAASTITTRRSVIARRGPVIGRFMRAMAEASRTMHRDKERVYRVMENKLKINGSGCLRCQLCHRDESDGAALGSQSGGDSADDRRSRQDQPQGGGTQASGIDGPALSNGDGEQRLFQSGVGREQEVKKIKRQRQ